jgi:hypothetical protein
VLHRTREILEDDLGPHVHRQETVERGGDLGALVPACELPHVLEVDLAAQLVVGLGDRRLDRLLVGRLR